MGFIKVRNESKQSPDYNAVFLIGVEFETTDTGDLI